MQCNLYLAGEEKPEREAEPALPFKVEVEHRKTEHAEYLLRVISLKQDGTQIRSRVYELPELSHDTCMQLFTQVARDFDVSEPRRATSQIHGSGAAFNSSWQPLLTENMSADIYYGFGDPCVLQAPGVQTDSKNHLYYLVATSNDAPNSFPILVSNNLEAWKPVGFMFPAGSKPKWASDDPAVREYWAPEIHWTGTEFLSCFAARMRNRQFAVGVARSLSPEGPYLASKVPLLKGGIIDPHLLFSCGSWYLYWKEDTNDLWPSELSELLWRRPVLIALLFPDLHDQRTIAFSCALWPWVRNLDPMQRFLVQQVLIETVASCFHKFRARLAKHLKSEVEHCTRKSGRRILKLTKTRIYGQKVILKEAELQLIGRRVLVLANDQDWEGHVVEGVWVCKQNGRFFMFYSGGDFSTSDYGIGVAVANSPLGPYTKTSRPLLQSTSEWYGPGHPSVATGPDGRTRLFFHAYAANRVGYKAFRALLTTPISFVEDLVLLE